NEVAAGLNEVAQALDALTIESDDDTTSMILATMPAQRRHELMARNQARLVERALEQAEGDNDEIYATIESALRTYAQQSRTHIDTAPPAALQRRLSAAVDRRLARVALLTPEQLTQVADGA